MRRKIGRTTPAGELWGMIKRNRNWNMSSEEETSVSNRDKAEISCSHRHIVQKMCQRKGEADGKER